MPDVLGQAPCEVTGMDAVLGLLEQALWETAGEITNKHGHKNKHVKGRESCCGGSPWRAGRNGAGVTREAWGPKVMAEPSCRGTSCVEAGPAHSEGDSPRQDLALGTGETSKGLLLLLSHFSRV